MPKKWIQSAIRHEGALTRGCKKMGYSGPTNKCEAKIMKKGTPTQKKRVVLAKTLAGFHHKKK